MIHENKANPSHSQIKLQFNFFQPVCFQTLNSISCSDWLSLCDVIGTSCVYIFQTERSNTERSLIREIVKFSSS